MLEKKGLTVGFVILTALVSWGCNPTLTLGPTLGGSLVCFKSVNVALCTHKKAGGFEYFFGNGNRVVGLTHTILNNKKIINKFYLGKL